MASYMATNNPAPGAAAYVAQPTGTTLRTMLQITAGAQDPLIVWKWGLDFDGVAGSAPNRCELMSSSVATAVGASGLTAHVAAGITALGAIQSASAVVLATTGYSTLAAGTAQTLPTEANTRWASINSVYAGNGDRNEWALGREFYVPAGHSVKIRVHAPVAVGMACYICWDE
jgi:hypothetical protein